MGRGGVKALCLALRAREEGEREWRGRDIGGTEASPAPHQLARKKTLSTSPQPPTLLPAPKSQCPDEEETNRG